MVMCKHFAINCLLLCGFLQSFVWVEAFPGRLKNASNAEFLTASRLKELHQHILPINHMASSNVREMMNKIKIKRSVMAGLPAQALKTVHDNATFVDHTGGWIISGQWARYNLSFFGKSGPITKPPSPLDQSVLICNITSYPSHLSKNFIGLSNGSLSMLHFANFKSNMTLEGLITSDNNTTTFFNLTTSQLKKNNNKWVTSTFKIPPHLHNITITVQPRSSGPAVWAVSSIAVKGNEATINSPEFLTTVAPATTARTTVTNATTTTPMTNATMASLLVNGTTLMPVVNGTSIPVVNKTVVTNVTTAPSTTQAPVTKANGTHLGAAAVKEDPLKEIHGIASAIWDAFYVFLALFCACLVALVILIFRQR